MQSIVPGRDSLPFAGKVVLVTGASGLIGRAIAEEFAAAGASVAVHYLSNRALAEDAVTVLRQRGGRAIAYRADLTDDVQVERVVSEVSSQLGPMDVLVNNAAMQPVRMLPEMSSDEWRIMLEANTTTAFNCTQAAASTMRDRGGSIIHIASIEGVHPAWGHAHYSASKAALIAHARSAALEYGSLNIRVNSVSPGLVDRPGLEADWPDGVKRYRGRAPLQRLGRPVDVAKACLFLASSDASWITGHNLVVDGGMSCAPLY